MPVPPSIAWRPGRNNDLEAQYLMNSRIKQWVRPEVQALTAYHVPNASGFIKLDAMENPYSWPPHMAAQWLEFLRGVALNRYPDPSSARLKARLRETFRLPAESAVLLGNGSDELIQMILMAVAGPGRAVVAPEPSFSMYRIISTTVGVNYVGVPLTDDFSLDLAATRAAIDVHRPAVLFIAYPSNPTGNLFAAEDICTLIEAAPGLVVVDEAYTAFCDADFAAYLARYEHLLILRTVSKLGLAGLRLGFLVGAPSWLQEIDKLRLPYNINVLTQASAEFALEHYDMLQEQANRIRADRESLYGALRSLPGVSAFPSQANFILFRVAAGRAGEIFQRLKTAGVLIKSLHGSHPALHDCLRVTVGLPEENRAFLDALRQIL
jgi:histidinol-phosphate aminotransferase